MIVTRSALQVLKHKADIIRQTQSQVAVVESDISPFPFDRSNACFIEGRKIMGISCLPLPRWDRQATATQQARLTPSK